MANKKIHESLDEMLSNPKTKNFLNHLVNAYHPIQNIEKVLVRPKEAFKCVLTKEDLLSYQDVLESITDEKYQNDFIENLDSIFKSDSDTSSITKLIGDKKMAVIGKKTTTYMSYTSFKEFQTWILNKILNNDKNIMWMLNYNKEKNKPKENIEIKSTSTFTLGELDSFKQLYNKFK